MRGNAADWCAFRLRRCASRRVMRSIICDRALRGGQIRSAASKRYALCQRARLRGGQK